MRCWIFSDLHRDVGLPWTPSSIPVADVAIVAGDVGEGLVDSIGWLAAVVRPHMRVVFTAGNHEFYHTANDDELRLGRAAARNLGIDFLENDTVEIDGVSFFGCTLWTDYSLDGEDLVRASMEEARRGINDHRRIAWTHKPAWQRFRPEDALALHRASRGFLEAGLAASACPDGTPRARIVVTHHAPSARSVAPKYRDKPLNPYFASRLDSLIDASGPDLWVHGHTHTSFDYRVGRTRVVCNPKGYSDENRAFDPALLVEVPS
ncbi:metallophosphoesterase [Methylobacterium soli]|uniref:Metallophosphoesterase n=1 Tax=Methylobacterium soli TaxID=553447 RepID=A0A6L3SX41_9HYPH|nr:metallophosphoesterase [Methylobacterium soli]KAB1076755.1 metallophosphoesterase [Methylobacterium soli]GJE43379.1 hypothetical protein AEGHOMDF_2558 [Methylobacterium soli]